MTYCMKKSRNVMLNDTTYYGFAVVPREYSNSSMGALQLPDGMWGLHAATSLRSMTIMRNEEHQVKGMAMVIVNTGAGTSHREAMGDLKCISNRLHQLASGRIPCHGKSRPGGNEHKQAIIDLAKKATIGRILVRNANRSAHVRIALTQSAAFGTARKYTSNAEQKNIIRGWKDTGAQEFKNAKPEESPNRQQIWQG